MKKIFIMIFILSSLVMFAQDNKDAEIAVNETTTLEEVTITTKATRDLEGKIFDMGRYIACKFSKNDERKAIADGYITITPYELEKIRKSVAKRHNITEDGVFIISAKVIGVRASASSSHRDRIEFEVCVGGIKYVYTNISGVTRAKGV